MPRHLVAPLIPVLAIWGAAATALAIPARRVVDWFVMSDELFYERLSFSVARTGSPLPALHGIRVPAANQLYPLLLASVARHDLVPDWLVRAHTFNAILMTSAAVPAYLLARALLDDGVAAYAASLLSVVVPWLVLASFVVSEAAAYPAFLWAVYLLQRTIERPSIGGDLLALVGVCVALLARTQFAVLFVVAVVTVAGHDRSLRRSVAAHPVLALAAAAGTSAAVALRLAGHNVFGAYDAATHGSILDANAPRSLLEHAAMLALGLGLLPAILGAAWLGAAARRSAAALVAIVTVTLLLLEVTSFDLRFGGGLPRDRYVFYAAPLLLIGFVGALGDARLPRWSLAIPLPVVVAGVAFAPLPVFDKLNVDMPVAVLDDYVRRNGGRTMLVAAALLLVAIVYLARAVLSRRVVAVVLVAAVAASLVAETAYAFDRLLRVPGTSGRPITVTQGVVFDWIDRTLGTGADVTMIPYAQIQADYWATAGFWWDLEFWNRSVTRAAYPGNRFAEIQSTFPKIDLRFDRATGRAWASPTRYVAESDLETRFRVRGATVSLTRNVRLIDAGRTWRADWVTAGLDDDGFTVPGRTARLRIYPELGQTRPLRRFVTFHVVAHSARLGVTIGHTSASVGADHDADVSTSACVHPQGYATVPIRAHGETRVYGDLGGRAGIYRTRIRGVQVSRISLADETSAC